MNPVLAELCRGGLLESEHRGAISVVRSGREILQVGDTRRPVFPRSALKPLQVLPLVEAGLVARHSLRSHHVALLCASHGGDERQASGVAEILRLAGLTPDLLHCGVHPPFDAAAGRLLVQRGESVTVLHHNCSGKHAGMLILARHLGAPLDSYTAPEHPVQVRIRAAIAACCGMREDEILTAVDGCSAPAFALPLRALATGMEQLAHQDLSSARGRALAQVFDAFVSNPDFVSAPRQLDQALVRAGAGRILAKRGAEGVLGIALRPFPGEESTTGIAVKIDDGSARGTLAPVRAVLARLGVSLDDGKAEWPDALDGILRNFRGLEVGHMQISSELPARLEPLIPSSRPESPRHG